MKTISVLGDDFLKMSFDSQSNTLKNNAINFSICKRCIHRSHCGHGPTKMIHFSFGKHVVHIQEKWADTADTTVVTAAPRMHNAVNTLNDHARIAIKCRSEYVSL